MHNQGWDEVFFITQFMRGLKPEIRGAVQSQDPTTMDRAIALARIQQQVADRTKPKWGKTLGYAKQSTQSVKTEVKQGNPSGSLWKERLTRDYRKANGLCYFCAEKYDPNHALVCPKRPGAQVNALVVNPLDTELTEEVLTQLALEDSLATEFCQLSLNALSGTDTGDTLKVRALVNNKVMLILVGSGSSHSFVNRSFLDTVGITPTATHPSQVKLANGDSMVTDHGVPQFSWWVGGHTLHVDMKVLDLGAYDAISGYDWLKAHSPMTYDWDKKTLEFQHLGQQVKLQGILRSTSELQEVAVEQVMKWTKGNDIWAMAVVDVASEPQVCPANKELQQLLSEFQDVFQTPQTLPPERFYDHHIPLLPGVPPVNSRPYKYSPQHKTEIERQVQELLQAGFIERSSSPFASPVLLVLKKDGSWRFCVDYGD